MSAAFGTGSSQCYLHILGKGAMRTRTLAFEIHPGFVNECVQALTSSSVTQVDSQGLERVSLAFPI